MNDVVIVTGASSGIGAATARLLGAQGASVVVNYRQSEAQAEGVVAAVTAAGGRALAIRADMGQEDDIVRLFEETDRAFGPLTGLVNNAGNIGPELRALPEYTFKAIMDILAVNTAGLLVACRQAVNRMSTKNGGQGGSIVNVSSIAALTGGAGRYIHYAGSKGAVDSMTLGTAVEVARQGIRVNAVRPGTIDTPIHDKVGQRDRVMRAASDTPLGRAGSPEEVAESIVWLLSSKASLVTGAILNVMGAQR